LLIFTNMKKTLERTVEIPEGMSVTYQGNTFVITGNGKTISRMFDAGKVAVSTEGKKIFLKAKNATRRESAMIGTMHAGVKNMIAGLQKPFEYTLEICNVHFPMNVKVEGNTIIIKSFLGERVDRHAKIAKDVDVSVKGNQVIVTSHDIEAAGQTAANLEKATHLTGRDRRIFQDGIFITMKNGRKV